MSCNGYKAQEIDDRDWMPVPFYFLQTSHKYHEENHERILGNLPFCICSENKNSILLFTNPKSKIVDFVWGSGWHLCFPRRPLRTPKNQIPVENEIVSLSSPSFKEQKVFRFHRKWKQWSLMNKNAFNGSWNICLRRRDKLTKVNLFSLTIQRLISMI